MSNARRAVLLLSCLLATTAGAAGPEPLAGGPWPRTWTEGALTLFLFQPEVQKWEGDQLTLRAAAQVKKGEKQTYGLVDLQARTEVDQARKVVRLLDVQVTRTEFPSVPEKEQHWRELFGKHLAASWEVALDKLQADAAVAAAERARTAVPPRNDPPVFVFRTAPALLVLIDGDPSWRAVEGTGLERIVNTRPLVLRDPGSGRVWLRLLDGWMTAPGLEQHFVVATGDGPAGLEKARAWAATQPLIDLLDGQPPPDSPPPPAGQKPPAPPTLAGGAPEIVVAHTPTELIITEGEPQLEPISGTSLVTWKNTSADVLVDTHQSALYVLVAGRWFTAATTQGPWRWVEPSALPADFARIPPGSAREAVLSSVPGTRQAREARIANQVPQTATVQRSQAKFTPTYDGEPRLEPVEGTQLQYVLNANTPIIRVSPTEWYAVENGVWFFATSPQGPWVAATSVPAAIYSIPASSPVHTVTYVRVYDATPEVIYVGYTPGYLGTYVGPEGVVYYGTGYRYHGWLGAYWWGPPVTYGYGLRVGWSSWGGWGVSVGWGWTPPGYWWGYGVSPYWGPPGYYRPYYYPGARPRYDRPPPPNRYYRGGAYGSWGAAVRPTVRPDPRPSGFPARPPPAGVRAPGPAYRSAPPPGARPGIGAPPPSSRPGVGAPPPSGRPGVGAPRRPFAPAWAHLHRRDARPRLPPAGWRRSREPSRPRRASPPTVRPPSRPRTAPRRRSARRSGATERGGKSREWWAVHRDGPRLSSRVPVKPSLEEA